MTADFFALRRHYCIDAEPLIIDTILLIADD